MLYLNMQIKEFNCNFNECYKVTRALVTWHQNLTAPCMQELNICTSVCNQKWFEDGEILCGIKSPRIQSSSSMNLQKWMHVYIFDRKPRASAHRGSRVQIRVPVNMHFYIVITAPSFDFWFIKNYMPSGLRSSARIISIPHSLRSSTWICVFIRR